MTCCASNRARSALRLVAVALAATGCLLVLVDCEGIAPRHSWSRRWGPTVPHTTFPSDCGICHSSEDWKVLREDFQFDHLKETGYALEGAHEQAACLRCHNDRGPVEVYVRRGCGGCHVDIHSGTLGAECTRCHNQEIWAPVGLILDHAQTRFPLVGVHAITPCETCHDRATVGEYRNTPVECQFCHRFDAVNAFPNHVVNGWNRDCERCHTPLAWTTETFSHDQFPLVGGHAGVDCLQCHPGGRFQGTPNDCFSCHQNDYVNAPNHVAGNFSTICTDCHNTTAWK